MRDIAIYTGLRLALLAAVWLLLQVVTPFRGLIALIIALLISGVVSVVLLDRPRDRAGNRVAGVFKRIDERIERSRTAEDYEDEVPPVGDVDEVPPVGDVDEVPPVGEVNGAGATGSGQADADTEQHPVGQGEETGHLQHRDEGPPAQTP